MCLSWWLTLHKHSTSIYLSGPTISLGVQIQTLYTYRNQEGRAKEQQVQSDKKGSWQEQGSLNALRRNAPPRPRGGGSRHTGEEQEPERGFPRWCLIRVLEDMLNLARCRRWGNVWSVLPAPDHLVSYFREVLGPKRRRQPLLKAVNLPYQCSIVNQNRIAETIMLYNRTLATVCTLHTSNQY